MVTEAIILAGGLGTRLRSVVSDLPKVMAPIAGQPFLVYLLQLLEANGVRRVVLSVGYRNEAIRGYFGSSYGSVQLTYSVEEEPLGTGGGLLQSIPYIKNPLAFVLNGDTFLKLNYRHMASALDSHPDASLAVALRYVPDTSRYGRAVVVGDRIQGFSARGTAGPGLINAGCYLLSRDIFQKYPMPLKFSWEKDFLEDRAAEVLPIAFQCDVRFIDIGTPEAVQQAQTLVPAWMDESD